jgi:UDP-3-O-[3-hydroxymyristoyl] glucosamine N-acyltransferase
MLQGSPAIGYSDYNKSYIHFKNLPQTMKIINQLEKKINNG